MSQRVFTLSLFSILGCLFLAGASRGCGSNIETGVTETPIEEYLNELGPQPKEEPIKNTSKLSLPSKNDLLKFTSISKKISANVCNGLNSDNFCMHVKSSCDLGSTDDSCWFANPEAQKARASSPSLKKKIFSHAQSYLKRLTSDPEFLEQCCSTSTDPKTCNQRLSETSLFVVRGLNQDSDRIHFVAFDKSPGIRAAESTFTNAGTYQLIEELILHEMGHACQYARFSNRIDAERALLTNACEAASSVSHTDLSRIFGSKLADCVLSRLEAELPSQNKFGKQLGDSLISHKPKVCFGAWTKEAFAEIVFMRWRPSIAHWSWACGIPSVPENQYNHGPSRAVLSCLLEQGPLKPTVCAK